MVLGRPIVLESDGIHRLRDLDLTHEARMLGVIVWGVHLGEDPELHGGPPSVITAPMRAAPTVVRMIDSGVRIIIRTFELSIVFGVDRLAGTWRGCGQPRAAGQGAPGAQRSLPRAHSRCGRGGL